MNHSFNYVRKNQEAVTNSLRSSASPDQSFLMAHTVSLWTVSLLLCSLALIVAIQPPISPTAISVLGAQIIEDSSGKIIPAFHTMSRVVAAASWQKFFSPSARFIMHGGYNVGVRYLLNGTLLSPANFTFESFSLARGFISEGEVMKQTLCSSFSVSEAQVLTEEVSATTTENAAEASLIFGRAGFFSGSNVTNSNSNLTVAVLTNLYHMVSALPDFKAAFLQSGIEVFPLFAEDYVAFMNATYWIPAMQSYYSSPRGGLQWNATAIAEIMTERLTGNLNLSVGQLMSTY